MDQSPRRIVQSEYEVKIWMERPPSVEQVRPGKCPCCEAASRPLGCALSLWGHGIRERQLSGPLEPNGKAQIVSILARRYLCKCGAVILVVPRGVLPRRRYSAMAIALSLALFGIEDQSAAEVRRQVSPWQIVGSTAHAGWVTIRRWIRATQSKVLFAKLRASPLPATARQVAKHVATTLTSYALPSLVALPMTSQAFYAGAQMA